MDKELTASRSIQRSHAYPSATILVIIEFVKKIYTQLGVSSFQTRETIAKVLNFAPDTLNKWLSSAVQYALLELKSKVGYKATPLFIRIIKPFNEKERTDALLECLQSPKLYAALLEEYSNNIVPSVIGLSTNLYRTHNISDKASEKAAQIFIQNLQDLKLLDEENHLLFDNPAEEVEAIQENALLPQPVNSSRANQIVEKYLNFTGVESEALLPLHITLKDSRKVKLLYPEGMTNEDWDKVIKIIEVMKT